MRSNHTKPNKTRRWKALSQAQENALMLLLQGKTDTEVAADPSVDVTRGTVWYWRMHDVLFAAELASRRGALVSNTVDGLRASLSRAVENIQKAIDEGSVQDSWLLLKSLGLFGVAHVDPGVSADRVQVDLERLAHNQACREYEAMDPNRQALASINGHQDRRKQEILQELIDQHSEPDNAP